MDQATIEQARRGSRTAQGELLRQLQDCWYRLAVSLLRDRELARDACQEAALRFLKGLGGFRSESSLQTWSLGIVVNVCRELRRSMRDPSAIAELRRAAQPQGTDPPDEAGDDATAALRQAIGQLPERQREAIAMRFFEEMSVEATASAMNCAQGIVKATVHQALRALREKLRQLT